MTQTSDVTIDYGLAVQNLVVILAIRMTHVSTTHGKDTSPIYEFDFLLFTVGLLLAI